MTAMTRTTRTTPGATVRASRRAVTTGLFLAPLALALGAVTLGAPRAQAADPTTPAVTPEAVTGAYGVDKAHTDITFTVPHLVVSKVRGRFNDFDGTVNVDAKKPEN